MALHCLLNSGEGLKNILSVCLYVSVGTGPVGLSAYYSSIEVFGDHRDYIVRKLLNVVTNKL